MTWSRNHVNDIIATPGQMQRFGIDENFDAIRGDPRNARYLVPLADPDDEELAAVFAAAVYDAIAYDHGGFASSTDSDWCYEQCLINGRKYQCEPEYAVIFEQMTSIPEPPSLDQPRQKFLH